MIALDTNVILHCVVSSHSRHKEAKAWIENEKTPLCTTHTNLAETLRLLTHDKVFPKPLKLAPAIDLVSDFVDGFEIRLLDESPDWWLELKEVLKTIPHLKGNEIFDARIALCLRYNGVQKICTFDSDFRKYAFLKVMQPEN